MTQMVLSSPAFVDTADIPRKYTCDGDDINPPLVIAGVPDGTKSLALIMSDPDAPAGLWVHWVIWNIDPATGAIPEASVPTGAIEGTNSWGKRSYGGPCPPQGKHRYYFYLYALKEKLELPHSTTAGALERAMRGVTLASCELLGTYARK